ncbi:hypothetical protein TELCIR_16146 [Teladorsagia circumcincta]|uniref:MSP domain-containing protein n=1 Tax=Teladorsagia circumcincta TaxID=45464 RepID=A0A2G9TWA5_TELCI|nr:hypothetical protein TELCIR_16146 [Teladorsagia circumcincta]
MHRGRYGRIASDVGINTAATGKPFNEAARYVKELCLLQSLAKIVLTAPYNVKHTYHIKIINASGRRIGWVIKTINMKRLTVDPACGVLDLKEATPMAVSCDTFGYGSGDTTSDRITFE